jgi:hypothetical protein
MPKERAPIATRLRRRDTNASSLQLKVPRGSSQIRRTTNENSSKREDSDSMTSGIRKF